MAIWEGLSCGAIVITTDLPPMNETPGVAYCIKPILLESANLGRGGIVDGGGVKKAVEWAKSLTDDEIAELSRKAREAYVREVDEFKENFAKLMRGEPLTAKIEFNDYVKITPLPNGAFKARHGETELTFRSVDMADRVWEICGLGILSDETLDLFCKTAKLRGMRYVFVDIPEDNLSAQELYRRNGFVKSGCVSDYYRYGVGKQTWRIGLNTD